MARRFIFSLEKVLDYRAQLEEQARLQLAVAQRAYQEQVARVSGLREALARHERSLNADDGPLSAADIWLWRNYKERLFQDLAKAEATMLDCAKELNKCRREAIVRSKDRKLLEKLKTRQAIRHAEEHKLAEQKEHDEMATLRYQPQAL